MGERCKYSTPDGYHDKYFNLTYCMLYSIGHDSAYELVSVFMMTVCHLEPYLRVLARYSGAG